MYFLITIRASIVFGIVPFLIFGLSITRLLSEWKRLFDTKKYFIPYLLYTIMLTELAVYSIFVYVQLIEKLPELNYINYMLYLLPPVLFFIVVNIFTPDPGSDTKTYFINRMLLFFVLFAVFLASQYLYELNETSDIHILRLVVIICLLINGLFYRKIWLTYSILILWILGIILRGNMFLTESISML